MLLNTRVLDGVNNREKGVSINIEGKNGKSTLDVDICLVSIGRHAYTEGLQLEKAGLSTNERGQVEINDHWQTKVDGIYAIGDAVKG